MADTGTPDQTNSGSDPQTNAHTGSTFSRLGALVSANRVAALLWATRVFTILAVINFFLPIFGFDPVTSYQKALISNAATSALRLHQRLPQFQLSREFFNLLLLEDSAHYLFYSLIFVTSRPVTMVLVPLFLFALLHASSYTKQILDQIGPNSLPLIRNMLLKLQNNQVGVLRFIAVNEIFMMPVIIFMIFAGSGSILMPFVYYRFLSLRYASRRNPYCRQLFYELRVTAEHYSSMPACPAIVRNLTMKLISFVNRIAPI